MSSTSPPLSGFPRRALAARLALVALAIGLGLFGQHWLTGYLAQIQELAKTDLLGARAWLARVFQVGGLAVFGSTAAVGVGVLVACRRSLASGVFPPAGRVWSWGGRRPVTGRRARLAAYTGIGLGAILLVASAAGLGLAWYAAAVLRACRAGIPR